MITRGVFYFLREAVSLLCVFADGCPDTADVPGHIGRRRFAQAGRTGARPSGSRRMDVIHHVLEAARSGKQGVMNHARTQK